jgi:glycosyltransferase involved in cell wall biosynthesis
MTIDFRPPRVSVISIFYNAEPYFAEAIDSVLRQDCDDFELILVDDGSTDGSSALASSRTSRDPERIRYMEHPGHQNRGMSASRNRGLSEARGEFVAFIDADDRWASNKLSEQLRLLDEHPEVDAVCGAVNYWSSWGGGEDRLQPTGHIQNRPVPPPNAALRLYPLGSAAPPCPSDLLLRKSIVAEVGGFEDTFTGALQAYEDQAFLAKIYLAGTMYFASRHWLDYRVHAEGFGERVRRDGKYDEVRRHFLEWYLLYLEGKPADLTGAIRAKVERALFPYRHPRLARAIRPLQRVSRRALA